MFELKNQSNEADEKEVQKIVFGELKSEETNELLKRKKRQAPGYQGPTIRPNVERSPDGIPILEGAYPTAGTHSHLPTEHPTESEGLRIYESLIETGGHGEPKAEEFAESDGSNLKPYHKTSAAWVEKSTSPAHSRFELKSGGGSTNEDPLYIRGSDRHYSSSGAIASQHNFREHQSDRYVSQEQQPRPSVIVRSSRVPSTGDYVYPTTRPSYRYPPLRKIGHGDGEVIARVHQEDPSAEDRVSGPEHVSTGARHGEAATAFAESRRSKGGFRTSSSDENPTERHLRGRHYLDNNRRRDNRRQNHRRRVNGTSNNYSRTRALVSSNNRSRGQGQLNKETSKIPRVVQIEEPYRNFYNENYKSGNAVPVLEHEGIQSRRNVEDRFGLYKRF